MSYPRIATLKSASLFREHLDRLGISLAFDEALESGPDAPLARPLIRSQGTIGNRFCILPMEGWDGTEKGCPTELTRYRWRNFGISGAKLIWGGEAVAVRHDGRANPNQLLLNEQTLPDISDLLQLLSQSHAERFGRTDDLLVGLQLTHSGRFARPNDKRRLEPRALYHHPLLASKYRIQDDAALLSDDEIAQLVDDFVIAARLAQQAGFQFVDIKHCHGYLGHEFLSSYDRPGRYGGSFENRTRFLKEIVDGIRTEVPGLEIGVRVSIYDFAPFHAGPENVGESMFLAEGLYRYAFGGDGTGQGVDLTETMKFFDLLQSLSIELVCSTAGSPYYNPHMQRPAAFPPSDGYLPPEDPLVSVARQIEMTARMKARYPGLLLVGSGYSYLQDWLPHVGQAAVRNQLVDSIGLGRMVLSYPELPADVLSGKPMVRRRICRTFSDCTTAPRNGMVSGCYPLDPLYRERPERELIAQIKSEQLQTRSDAAPAK
ncbi:NADH:flavin oxidoreductase [Planctomicrobium sp. SH661]|uniref:oxidoreductase n=1 Tax=Planctomicrobium sp. SH661 TaxID=3448124 RepID=UPI003F5C2BDB